MENNRVNNKFNVEVEFMCTENSTKCNSKVGHLSNITSTFIIQKLYLYKRKRDIKIFYTHNYKYT